MMTFFWSSLGFQRDIIGLQILLISQKKPLSQKDWTPPGIDCRAITCCHRNMSNLAFFCISYQFLISFIEPCFLSSESLSKTLLGVRNVKFPIRRVAFLNFLQCQQLFEFPVLHLDCAPFKYFFKD